MNSILQLKSFHMGLQSEIPAYYDSEIHDVIYPSKVFPSLSVGIFMTELPTMLET